MQLRGKARQGLCLFSTAHRYLHKYFQEYISAVRPVEEVFGRRRFGMPHWTRSQENTRFRFFFLPLVRPRNVYSLLFLNAFSISAAAQGKQIPHTVEATARTKYMPISPRLWVWITFSFAQFNLQLSRTILETTWFTAETNTAINQSAQLSFIMCILMKIRFRLSEHLRIK